MINRARPARLRKFDTLLPSAVYDASQNPGVLDLHDLVAIYFVVNVTVKANGESLSFSADIYDDEGTEYTNLVTWNAAVNDTTGMRVMSFGPVTTADVIAATAQQYPGLMPNQMEFKINHSAAGNWTYSLMAVKFYPFTI